jgi:hypothetical protein
MHLLRVRRSTPSAAAVLTALAVLALMGGAVASAGRSTTPHLGGTWSGKYGGAVSGTFTLHWTQTRAQLKGTITLSNPHGKYAISGRVTGSGIKFGAVGVGAIYKGTVAASGLRMSGTWTSGPGGGSWNAHKLLTAPKKVS